MLIKKLCMILVIVGLTMTVFAYADGFGYEEPLITVVPGKPAIVKSDSNYCDVMFTEDRLNRCVACYHGFNRKPRLFCVVN